jgi:hypothetical protein
MADPVGAVERIHARAGRPLSAAHRSAIRAWVDQHPQNKHGAHKYAMDEFGLGPEPTNRQFTAYLDRFGFGYGVRPPTMD